MTVTTKIETRGLVRDAAPELSGDVNALRRAENAVVRSPGVVETRPSFSLLYESNAFVASVRALREFQGTPLALIKIGSSWGLTNLLTATGLGGPNLEPVNYDQCETKFAEARLNLYLTTLLGVIALEGASAGPRVTGINMMMQTDLAATQEVTIKSSCAYRIVFVRKDSNGYIRRSPPSQRIICTLTGAPQTFGVASQLYFTPGMQAGDQIEIYRSLSQTGLSPRPEHYLAVTYTLTAADVALGRTVNQIVDSTPDNLLGAQLYTDAAVDGAVAEKFPPPQAQTLALWQRCMWYGRTKSPSRMVVPLQNLYFAGVASFCTWHRPLGTQPRKWVFDTVGGATVTTADTTGVTVGQVVTDALLVGPSVAGADGDAINAPMQWIKPGTRVQSVVLNTSVTLDQGTYTQNPAATPLRDASQPIMSLPVQPVYGLDAFQILAEVFTSRKLDLLYTGNANTAVKLRSGMYITDSPNGPTHNGTVFAANTRIFYAADLAGWYIDRAPLAAVTGCTAYVGDVVTVNGVEFYPWQGDSGVPWSTAMGTDRLFGINYVDSTISAGPVNVAQAVQNLCAAINSHAFQTTGFPRATPIGDTWDARDYEYGADGLRQTPGTLATSFLLESDFASTITMSCTSTAAFPLPSRSTVGGLTIPGWPVVYSYTIATQTSDDQSNPNRVYFSAVDEPEAVPLLNYIDIGSKGGAILALVPLRNALLVFKQDGVWRITGSGPSGWSVDPFDMTLNLLRPELVSVSQNKAYAWCKGGVFEIDETGSRSLTAGKLDVELRELSEYLTSNTTHGAWVAVIQQRNLVLVGVPTSLGGSFTGKIYCFHQTTEAWTEWPLSWGKAAESSSYDRLYHSRPEAAASTGLNEIDVEVRRMYTDIRGYDRSYDLGASFAISGSVVTISYTDIGTWRPIAGDWLSATDGTTRVYRRILSATFNAGTWTITLEGPVTDAGGLLITDAGVFFVTDGGVFFLVSDLSGWQAHEACVMALEWHPTAPNGIPVGAIAREVQFELDLRKAPEPIDESSLPEYIAGGSTERDLTPVTLTSNMARVKTVQMLRMGLSRQVARGATLAPYFQTSDIYAVRVVGGSVVHEGTSERTRR